MKDGWIIQNLGELVLFQGGGTPSTENPDFWNGDIPWVSPKDMKFSEIDSSEDKITEAAIVNSATSLVPRESLLIVVRSGILARVIPVGRTIREVAINQDIKAMIPGDRVNARYLQYFLLFYEREILSLVTRGATVHRLPTDSLKSIRVPIPPIPEQKLIVAFLDEAFEGIAIATANAEKNLANAQELFESYLNSIFEETTEDWVIKSIDEIAEVRGGKRLPKGHEFSTHPTGYRYISVADFNENGGIDEVTVRYISEKTREEIKRYTISSKDIYISIAGTIGKTGIIPVSLDGANLTENACKLVPRGSVNSQFLYYFTRTRSFFDQAVENTRTTAQPKLALERLKTITLGLPDISEQIRVVSALDTLKDETYKLEAICRQKIVVLAELKQSILQKAFSGELTAHPQPALRDAAE